MPSGNINNLFKEYFTGDRNKAVQIKRRFIFKANVFDNIAKTKKGNEKKKFILEARKFRQFASRIKLNGFKNNRIGGFI